MRIEPRELGQIRKTQREKWESALRDSRARSRRHTEGTGWPHLSSVSGNCMCLDSCCFGVAGCHCRECPCGGRGHGPASMRTVS